ncbi:hypothetical protein [Sorangium sp. So ce406]
MIALVRLRASIAPPAALIRLGVGEVLQGRRSSRLATIREANAS